MSKYFHLCSQWTNDQANGPEYDAQGWSAHITERKAIFPTVSPKTVKIFEKPVCRENKQNH